VGRGKCFRFSCISSRGNNKDGQLRTLLNSWPATRARKRKEKEKKKEEKEKEKEGKLAVGGPRNPNFYVPQLRLAALHGMCHIEQPNQEKPQWRQRHSHSSGENIRDTLQKNM